MIPPATARKLSSTCTPCSGVHCPFTLDSTAPSSGVSRASSSTVGISSGDSGSITAFSKAPAFISTKRSGILLVLFLPLPVVGHS